MSSGVSSSSAASTYCDENQGITGLVFSWLLLAIGIIVVSLRLHVRLGLRHNIGWDDCTAVVSLMVGIIAAGFFTKMVTSGMGRHVSCLPPQSVISMLEFSAISEAINVTGIGVVKISVCLTLLRVVERGRRRISHFSWFLLVFVAVTHLALAMLFFLHCRPLAALWNPQIDGSCLSTHTTVLAGYIGFTIDVVTGLICAGIPILVIHRLQMNNQTKVALCTLMGLGIFTAVCAVIKAITLKGVFANDYTWGFTKPATWAALEQFIGIIISLVPALRPLFSGLLESTFNWSHLLLNTRKYLFWEASTAALILMKLAGDKERSSQSTTVDEEAKTASVGYIDEIGEGSGINFLSAWSLPNIADRKSAMFSIYFLVV
ncbi:hypothetical protein JMJ35_009335 [Cladonia borealis]|uniref:Rhodopsin domain-containing protein n=1 Tax=Cladonia borealis TaxID=184061 RepID=A0AA39QUS8_9LECA|nr:hypothetical protein JMJ35_009335 [Cladonia borealis]